MPDASRVLVIGLDGATLDLIEPWVKMGYLPNIQKLFETGTYGRLRSVIPVLSSAAWSSFITGMEPGKHGIYDFLRRESGSYRLRVVRRDNIQAPSLWRILGQQGRKVGVMNVPMTYPPEEVNGFLVSGLGTPEYKPFTYPTELGKALLERGYRVNKQETYQPGNEDRYLRELFLVANSQLSGALWLIKEREWDFFMVVFYDTDQIAHKFWRFMDPAHPAYPGQGNSWSDAILKFYEKMDDHIGELVEAAGPGATVLVMSDHGEGPLHQDVFLNEWLRQVGFLKTNQEIAQLTGRHQLFARLGLTRDGISNFLRSSGLGRVERWIKDILGDRIDLLPKTTRAEFPQAIDWSQTRAYSFGYQGQIFINLQGREPLGIVAPGEDYEHTCQEIIHGLMSLTDPRDKQPVVDQVLRREQIFNGPYIEHAPDLTLIMRGYTYNIRQGYEFSPTAGKVFSEPALGESGSHRPEGVLIASGPGILPGGYKGNSAKISDVAPTILHLLGCPVPAAMDGRVLEDWISTEQAPQIDHQLSEEAGSQSLTPSFTEEEEQELVARLKSLGYLE